MRKEYTARICVYREGCSSTLRVMVRCDDGTKFDYYKAPQGFVRPTQGGGEVKGNLYIATFTANEDGSRPLKVKVVKEITRTEWNKWSIGRK